MQQRILIMVLLMLLVAPGVLIAQDTDESSAESTMSAILEALMLPKATQEAREAGVPEEDIGVVIDLSRERDIPARETREILEQTTESVRESGPIDNFGSFVQARLDEGLRGRDLAAAIRAEHQARGRGAGKAGQVERGSQGKRPDSQEHDDADVRSDDEEAESSGKGKGKGEGDGNGGSM